MTKERAIELIEMTIAESEWNYAHDEGEWDLIEALKIAKEALKEEE